MTGGYKYKSIILWWNSEIKNIVLDILWLELEEQFASRCSVLNEFASDKEHFFARREEI